MKLLTTLILSTILMLLLFQDAKPQPIMRIQPAAIEAEFPDEANIREYPVTLSNEGDDELRWITRAEIISEPDEGRNGRPDEADYQYRFSRTPSGPSYEWLDHEGVEGATQLEPTDDWISDEIDLDFTIRWYGRNYGSIRVCSNGWITFDADYDGVDAELPQPPDDAAPNNLLLVNSVDLNPEAAGEIWIHSAEEDDLNIMVVSWIGVAHADNEEVLSTFQVLIHESGLVIYQYGEMVGHEGEGVIIGYENHDGSIGATIEPEAEHYVSQRMAVGIGKYSMFRNNWMTRDPQDGELDGGGEADIFVLLDKTGLIGGDYEADLIFISADQDDNDVRLNVLMHVEGEPDIEVDRNPIDFNEDEEFLFVGERYEVPLRISNIGNRDLQINDITIDHEYFSTDWDEDDQIIDHFDFLDINIFFEPEEAGLIEGVITINSNDFDEEDFEITVRGDVIEPDGAIFEPDAYELDMRSGEIEAFAVQMGWRGERGVDWWLELEATPNDERNSEPDEAGYAYQFIHSPFCGIEDYWISIEDLEGAEQLEATDDWNSGIIELGFDVPWYGETYSSIRICSNGWITFDEDYDGTDANLPPSPDDSAPNNILQINSIDLNPEITGEIWYYTDDDSQATVSWLGVAHAGDEEVSSTFQVIINADGLITYHYGEMVGHEGEDVFIGYENQNGSLGANITVEADFYSRSETVIGIGTRDVFRNWITLGFEEQNSLTIVLDATGISEGDYEANCLYFVEEEEEHIAQLNILVHVEGAPSIRIEPDFIIIDDDPLYRGGDYAIAIEISNIGTMDLFINEVSSDLDIITTDWNEENNVFASCESFTLMININTEEVGLFEGAITISTNDPLAGEFEIPISILVVDPDGVDKPEPGSIIPEIVYLSAVYPNPFNSMSRIEFGLPVPSAIILKIVDANGKTISTLSSGLLPAGHHGVTWNANGIPAGIYFCQLSSHETVRTVKLLLVK